MQKKLFFVIGLLVMIVVVSSMGLFAQKRWEAHFAAGPLRKTTSFQLESGQGLSQISQRLEAMNIIEDAWSFQIIARLQQVSGALKAGDYRFSKDISAHQVLDMLVRGKTRLYSLTIPEGLTSQQISHRILQTPQLSGDLPNSLLEASILPETYHFERGMPRKSLITLMQKRWRESIQPLWEARPENYPLKSLEEVLILASIVEKEAIEQQEMPIIARVFLNRLQKGMKLQSDPTVIYALSNGLGKIDRRLLRADWKLQHDHNTYYRHGLPPTPIAHPSLAALKATLNPSESDDIFFVADGKGGHRFSATLEEHNANVAKLKKLRKTLRQK